MTRDNIKVFLKELSSFQEMWLVFAITIAYFVRTSNYDLIARAILHIPVGSRMVDDKNLLAICFVELLGLVLVFYILKIRGYTSLDRSITFKPQYIIHIIAIYAISNIVLRYICILFNDIAPSAYAGIIGHYHITKNASIISIVLLGIINPIYEEFLVVNYLFKKLEKLKPWLVIFISSIVRLSYHTYQGWACLITVLPLGIIFGFYYHKFKQTLPLIIVHSIYDILALSA